jgi:hypothetical protein
MNTPVSKTDLCNRMERSKNDLCTTAHSGAPHKTLDVRPSNVAVPPRQQVSSSSQASSHSCDDRGFDSLDSVHTSCSNNYSTLNSVRTSEEWQETDFDSEGSFASLGLDEDDEEAYEEQRNEMERVILEEMKLRRDLLPKLPNLRSISRQPSCRGTLDFIAE